MDGCLEAEVSAFVFTVCLHQSISLPCMSYCILFFYTPISHSPLCSCTPPATLSSCTSHPSITRTAVVTVWWALHFNTSSCRALSKMVPIRSTHGMWGSCRLIKLQVKAAMIGPFMWSLWFKVLGGVWETCWQAANLCCCIIFNYEDWSDICAIWTCLYESEDMQLYPDDVFCAYLDIK